MSMKIVRFLAVSIVLFIVGLAASETAAPQRVVALSYNIHHGEGMDGKIDLERLAAVIRSVSPDVVALQEVDRKTKRSGGVDQAEELARLTGMRMVYGRTMDYQGGEYGNAVLTRLPVKASANHALPFTKGREPRAVLKVELAATPTSAEQASSLFSFLATHFDFSKDSTDRSSATSEIGRLAGAEPNRPALLAGDLNSTPGSPTLKALGALWKVAGEGRELFTTPVARPRNQIDFILYRPADRWRVVEVRVLDEAIASDHRPILAVLELLSPRSAAERR
jgi:endonuclease/exonuclease/phosphatase family metal-dependent hydrolase